MQIPNRVMFKLYAELERAEKLHPDWPESPFIQLAIIQEEIGEATRALLDLHRATATHSVQTPQQQPMGFVEASPAVASREIEKLEAELEAELVQAAAMCLRMLSWMNTNEETRTKEAG